ncbi:class II aldolase/adducin family protein [Jannaschia sp. CCS1]|uniref:class II aldolase/adducin family protein n=1 Tax=Jannaschia sp. (strain CCS1) TaxID=290400 RepID=UPI000053BEDE|nr:class II aldolase/adducin family protein [Jannaschia sp. CCS1]ABD54312.1 class II aldolase/adducin-like protein [Jannaschia sp. CCS1]
MIDPTTFSAFRTLSARLGQDPLRVQGPGGNTSIKQDGVMWIKASGTELADAERADIFVAVDRDAAKSEAYGDGDGSCKTTVLDPAITLRPSIETTFHAALDWAVVAHTHSIAALTHGVSPQGRTEAATKLDGLPVAFAPYAKPGLPLTRQILSKITPETRVVVLENHGLICCGDTVEAVAEITEEVETRLAMPVLRGGETPRDPAPEGFSWAAESWLACDPLSAQRALAGSYYPDHVVFLGPALPTQDHNGTPSAIIQAGTGVLLRDGATPSQTAMLTCLANLLSRVPDAWTMEPIGVEAEAELLNWDAEKYRQALAARS